MLLFFSWFILSLAKSEIWESVFWFTVINMFDILISEMVVIREREKLQLEKKGKSEKKELEYLCGGDDEYDLKIYLRH